ncbi:MAG: hypothetical protein M0C28_32845 [Candidatus Moduliflexus flocculans]|nr:hypothetical protein [Candidatus Moduliflexus flocculans]
MLIAVCGLIVIYTRSRADRPLPDGGGDRPVHRRQGLCRACARSPSGCSPSTC